MTVKVCAQPGCPTLTTTGSYCTTHQPDHRSPSSKATSHSKYRRHRAAILKDNPQCTYCHQPATQVDHIVPVAQGGTNTKHNLQPICADCNQLKGSKSISRGGGDPLSTSFKSRVGNRKKCVQDSDTMGGV